MNKKELIDFLSRMFLHFMSRDDDSVVIVWHSRKYRITVEEIRAS